MYVANQRLVLPLSPEVTGYAAVLEAKLRLSGANTEWRGSPYAHIKDQLSKKVESLMRVPEEEAFDLAIAVGLLAMMLAEKSQLKKKGALALAR